MVDSRLATEQRAVRRRRECTDCGYRFTTFERLEQPPILVVKKGGQREQYDRQKVMVGLLKALHRRPISLQIAEDFALDLETRLRDRPGREVTSSALGEAVLDFLRATDHIAYVRYASVYHEFEDIDALFSAVRKLVEESGKKGQPTAADES